jgi:NH3-dependent NAD+ synthetase
MAFFEEYKRAQVGYSANESRVNGSNVEKIVEDIVNWLSQYLETNKSNGLITNLTQDMDSVITTVLCLKTGRPVIVHENFEDKSIIDWIKSKFNNIQEDLTLEKDYTTCEGINKVDLLGIGISEGNDNTLNPIGDLTKTDLKTISNYLDLPPQVSYGGEVIEDSLGVTYLELEWAMDYSEEYTYLNENGESVFDEREFFMLNEREKDVLLIYLGHNKNVANKGIIFTMPKENM